MSEGQSIEITASSAPSEHSLVSGETAPATRKRYHRRKGPEFGAALSFEEIAAALGVSHQCVHASYSSGLRKLRLYHPEKLAKLRLLSRQLCAARQARERGQVTVPAVRLPW